MNEYIGKICPFCKVAFKEGDDIVVCSSCDMPHHKDCWIANEGCTTYGCLGSMKADDGSATSVTTDYLIFDDTSQHEQGNRCSRCGTVNRPNDLFCAECGMSLNANPQSTEFAGSYAGSQNRYQNYSQPNEYGSPNNYGSPTPNSYGNPQNRYGNYNQPNGYGSSNGYGTPLPPNYGQQGSYGNPQNGYNNYNQPNSYGNSYYGATPPNNYGNPYNPHAPVNIDPNVIQLVGVKQDYYIPKFQEMKAQNKKVSWNWPAFLITPFWMFYRKMYGYGAAVFAGAFLLSLVGLSILAWVAYIGLGIFGNYIYMNFLEKKAVQMNSMPEPYKMQFAAKNGSVNQTAAIIAGVAYGVILLISIFATAGSLFYLFY